MYSILCGGAESVINFLFSFRMRGHDAEALHTGWGPFIEFTVGSVKTSVRTVRWWCDTTVKRTETSDHVKIGNYQAV